MGGVNGEEEKDEEDACDELSHEGLRNNTSTQQ